MSGVTIDKIKLSKDFENKKLSYQRLIQEVKEIIEKRLNEEPVDIFEVIPRLKKFERFYKKILEKNYLTEFFEKIEDVGGVRIVCKYYSELDRIGKCIGEEFNVVRVEKKITALEINEFGYLSDHYIVKLRNEATKETEKDLLSLKCEIQVRTLLMHSWATVSRDLDYKKEETLPEDIKKELYAISGLLYIADQRFDFFKQTSLSKLQEEAPSLPFINLQQNITVEKLVEYLEWKFPERSFGKIPDYHIFFKELCEMNYGTLADVDKMILKANPVLLEYEKKYPPNSISKSMYDRVGSARICIGIVDTENKKGENFHVIDLSTYCNMLIK